MFYFFLFYILGWVQWIHSKRLKKKKLETNIEIMDVLLLLFYILGWVQWIHSKDKKKPRISHERISKIRRDLGWNYGSTLSEGFKLNYSDQSFKPFKSLLSFWSHLETLKRSFKGILKKLGSKINIHLIQNLDVNWI